MSETSFPMRRYSCLDEVDAVVIGTGAGGAPLLARLASRGLKVVALEAGPSFEAARDFATDEKSQAKIFWRHERLTAGKDAIALGNNNSGTGVGGSTIHYTAYTPRPQPDDLRLREEFSMGEDWPLRFEELEPYLEEVEQFLGISGPADYPWGPPRRKPYKFSPLPLNAAAKFMKKGATAVGLQTSAAANAALASPMYQEGYGWRPACTNRGYCQAGCTTAAKSSVDVTYIPLAIAKGAEIRAEAFVTDFEREGDKIVGVVYQQGGSRHVQKCRAVFLAAGGIESPRLLLMHGLANGSGQVGRNFMAHPGTQVWGFFDDDFEPYRGIPGALISEDYHRAPNGEFAGGYLLQSIGVMPVTYVSQLVRGKKIWGRELREHMSRYRQVAGINILGECFPSKTNFVELSSEVDDMGLPKPRVHFSYGENERSMVRHAEETMRAIWTEAGARDLWTFHRSAHVIGTCRMGTSAEDSVVRPDGRAHDLENLYICDNSIFPSALSVNPSLTIMALSLRIADLFLSAHGKGPGDGALH